MSTKYDTELYMHGLCQYFALAWNQMYGGNVVLWLDDGYDEDEDMPFTTLCHAFAELAPNLFVDAYGLFKELYGRDDEFDYYEQDFIINNANRIKKILDELRVPFDDEESKKNVKDYLKNNMLAFKLKIDSKEYDFALYGTDKENIYAINYDKVSNTFGSFIHQFNKNNFTNLFVEQYGFVSNKDWWKAKK